MRYLSYALHFLHIPYYPGARCGHTHTTSAPSDPQAAASHPRSSLPHLRAAASHPQSSARHLRSYPQPPAFRPHNPSSRRRSFAHSRQAPSPRPRSAAVRRPASGVPLTTGSLHRSAAAHRSKALHGKRSALPSQGPASGVPCSADFSHRSVLFSLHRPASVPLAAPAPFLQAAAWPLQAAPAHAAAAAVLLQARQAPHPAVFSLQPALLPFPRADCPSLQAGLWQHPAVFSSPSAGHRPHPAGLSFRPEPPAVHLALFSSHPALPSVLQAPVPSAKFLLPLQQSHPEVAFLLAANLEAFHLHLESSLLHRQYLHCMYQHPPVQLPQMQKHFPSLLYTVPPSHLLRPALLPMPPDPATAGLPPPVRYHMQRSSLPVSAVFLQASAAKPKASAGMHSSHLPLLPSVPSTR